MAVDAFMCFRPYSGGAMGPPLQSESQVSFEKSAADKLAPPFTDVPNTVFEVETFNFDIEQTLNLSSQSRGTGAGKIKFNGFNVTRKIDKQSPLFFKMACAGEPFALVSLGFRKASGGELSGLFFLRFDFKMCAVETINWSHDEESPKEEIKFQFGAMQIMYSVQNNDGTQDAPAGNAWNQIKNVSEQALPGILPIIGA